MFSKKIKNTKWDGVDKSKISKYSEIFPWEEFLERYLKNHEEFVFAFDSKRLWLTYSDYTLTPAEITTIKMFEEFIATIDFSGRQFYEIWNKAQIEVNGEKIIKDSYAAFLKCVFYDNLHIKISYKNNVCEIYPNISEITGKKTFTLYSCFETEKDLLENARFNGKKLQEIWDELR